MKKASSGALLAAVAFAALAATAVATNYTVGGSDLWDTYIDYDKWTTDKTFVVGDTIEFKYMPYHNVLEVTEEDYAACNPGSPISTHSGGDTAFELTAAGTRYFICGIPRHCLNGTMHVKITTVPYGAAQAPLNAPPADAFAPGPAAGNSLVGAPSGAPRYQQPAAAVAGLAIAAFVALVA
ncbi:hypothetical protein SEVIR_2G352800v4 [Setaria viridis]